MNYSSLLLIYICIHKKHHIYICICIYIYMKSLKAVPSSSAVGLEAVTGCGTRSINTLCLPFLLASSLFDRRMRKSRSNGMVGGRESQSCRMIEWELRPGGMVVQKRSNVAGGPTEPLVKIKVSHGLYQHQLSVPAHSTFGELKRVLAQDTGLEPGEQRLLFRGKEKDDDERLHMAGIVEMSKLVLLEDPASKERKLERMNRHQASETIAAVGAAVGKLAAKVGGFPAIISKLSSRCSELIALECSMKAADEELADLTELLMVQLLKSDSLEAEGEARLRRRFEDMVETLDLLKARNSYPFISSSSSSSDAPERASSKGIGVGSYPRPASKDVPLDELSTGMHRTDADGLIPNVACEGWPIWMGVDVGFGTDHQHPGNGKAPLLMVKIWRRGFQATEQWTESDRSEFIRHSSSRL
ncbi:BAG domain [Musa troglodytarum]|uniref:BAG domain n=1 Tax=Musa troglodytarum TaxID=320322 RepID=A0A9E7JX97_9LILI|nr:BAG domain [Musa troglodytarum]